MAEANQLHRQHPVEYPQSTPPLSEEEARAHHGPARCRQLDHRAGQRPDDLRDHADLAPELDASVGEVAVRVGGRTGRTIMLARYPLGCAPNDSPS